MSILRTKTYIEAAILHETKEGKKYVDLSLRNSTENRRHAGEHPFAHGYIDGNGQLKESTFISIWNDDTDKGPSEMKRLMEAAGLSEAYEQAMKTFEEKGFADDKKAFVLEELKHKGVEIEAYVKAKGDEQRTAYPYRNATEEEKQADPDGRKIRITPQHVKIDPNKGYTKDNIQLNPEVRGFRFTRDFEKTIKPYEFDFEKDQATWEKWKEAKKEKEAGKTQEAPVVEKSEAPKAEQASKDVKVNEPSL